MPTDRQNIEYVQQQQPIDLSSSNKMVEADTPLPDAEEILKQTARLREQRLDNLRRGRR